MMCDMEGRGSNRNLNFFRQPVPILLIFLGIICIITAVYGTTMELPLLIIGVGLICYGVCEVEISGFGKAVTNGRTITLAAVSAVFFETCYDSFC